MPNERWPAMMWSHRGFLLCSLASSLAAAQHVWPTPRSLDAGPGRAALSPAFSFAAARGTARTAPLAAAMVRYSSIVQQTVAAAAAAAHDPAPRLTLQRAEVHVLSASTALRLDTSVEYNITISAAAVATISADTVYGAMHGMESFAQLAYTTTATATTAAGGSLLPVPLALSDGPEFAWRGLMLDVGRRFAPLPMIRRLLDTMSGAKLNVLHLHASDYCRWSVESKLFPAITSNLTVGRPDAGFYTQREVVELVAYAKRRGVRVVPEFEMPGHSAALRVLAQGGGVGGGGGLSFCHGTDWTLFDDPADPAHNGTYSVLRALLGELAPLFEDEVFHIGMDEVDEAAPCTANSTAALERRLLAALATELGKRPMGWDPVAAVADGMGEAQSGAAVRAALIVNSYVSSAGAAAFAAKNYSVVDAAAEYWYFTHPAGWDGDANCRPDGCAGPKGWVSCWHRPGGGIAPAGGGAAGGGRILGGEISLWTDDYSYPTECGAHGPGHPPANASCLYARALDDAFELSIGGITWPRGLVGAGAFYRFNANLDAASPAFTARIYALNDQLRARGAVVCPSGKMCSYIKAGGALYPGVPQPVGSNCSLAAAVSSDRAGSTAMNADTLVEGAKTVEVATFPRMEHGSSSVGSCTIDLTTAGLPACAQACPEWCWATVIGELKAFYDAKEISTTNSNSFNGGSAPPPATPQCAGYECKVVSDVRKAACCKNTTECASSGGGGGGGAMGCGNPSSTDEILLGFQQEVRLKESVYISLKCYSISVSNSEVCLFFFTTNYK